MKKTFRAIGLLFLGLISLNIQAQETKTTKEKIHSFFHDDIEYQAKIQLSLGGSAPLGIPAQIRKIESFKPVNPFGIEMNATKWIDQKKEFGIRAGLKFEGRGMKTQAKVKNYYTQIEDDSGAQPKGYFTGHVVTELENYYFTLPVAFVWNINDTWNVYGGFYFSVAANKSFSGYIYDGAFREGSPIGELTTFEDTAQGLYDFSEDLRSFQWGNQLGAEYKTKSNWRIFADLTMANNQAFKKSFEAISFKMYNIFGNIGAAYHF